MAQYHAPERFSLKSAASDSFFQVGLSSNIIAEIRLLRFLTWLEQVRLALHNGHKVFSHRTTSDSIGDNTFTNLLPKGGIPSISVDDQKIQSHFQEIMDLFR